MYFLNRDHTKEALWGHRPDFEWIKFYVQTAYIISMCLSTVNYVTNFFFYWCIGSSFRKEFRRMLSGINRRLRCRRAPPPTRNSTMGSSMYASNYHSAYCAGSSRRSVVNTVATRRGNLHSDLENHTIGQKRTSNLCYVPVRTTTSVYTSSSTQKQNGDYLYGTGNDACSKELLTLNSTV